jgi:hypothetical protein
VHGSFAQSVADSSCFFRQTPFKTLRIREPYVRKLLVGRAIWVTLLTILITAVLVVIFVFVPGKSPLIWPVDSSDSFKQATVSRSDRLPSQTLLHLYSSAAEYPLMHIWILLK